MADRQDIDALLVGALYGELSADESHHLDAHLASHPQDKAALDALTRTRARVREGLAAMPLHEPSAASTALLLQEAARRAPARKAAREGGGFLGWVDLLSRMFRPMLQHPALASAAALLLVGGAAGVIYMRGGQVRAYEPTAGARATSAEHVARAAEPPPPAAEPPAAVNYKDSYQASLDEVGGQPATATVPPPKPAEAVESGKRARASKAKLAADSRTSRDDALNAFDGDFAAAPADQQVALRKAPEKKAPLREEASKPKFVEVTTPEPQLKTEEPATTATNSAGRAVRPGARPAPAPAAQAAPAEVPAAPPPPPSAGATAGAGAGGGAKGASYDAAADQKRIEWARTQHERIKTAVKRKDCTLAGQLGTELAVRAPDYFVANVSNDRAVRPCRAYMDAAKTKEAERRAKSRPKANAAETDAADKATSH